MKKIRLISLVCILTLLLCSCGAKSDMAYDSAISGTTSGGAMSNGANYDKGYTSSPEASYPTKDDYASGSDISGSGVDADKIAESVDAAAEADRPDLIFPSLAEVDALMFG